MSAKMDVSRIIPHDGPLIHVPIQPEPTPTVTKHLRQQPQHETRIDNPTHVIQTKVPDETKLGPQVAEWNPPAGGTDVGGTPELPFRPVTTPVRRDAQLLTPASQLKPPYPADKLAAEQEATLRLALTIDANGRVTAVEPVGYADREFLASARRYIIGHWRYQPATEDGRPISTTVTITLQFQLDG
jgi:protein TonB